MAEMGLPVLSKRCSAQERFLAMVRRPERLPWQNQPQELQRPQVARNLRKYLKNWPKYPLAVSIARKPGTSGFAANPLVLILLPEPEHREGTGSASGNREKSRSGTL